MSYWTWWLLSCKIYDMTLTVGDDHMRQWLNGLSWPDLWTENGLFLPACTCRPWPSWWACLTRGKLVINAGFHYMVISPFEMRPRLPTHSISRDNFTQYRMGSRAPSLQQGWLYTDDGAGKPLLVPWLMVYLTLSSSWAAFLPRKRKCVAQRSSGFASKHRDEGEKGRRGSWPTLWQPQGEQQRNSCWWTAGWIKSASAGSAVGKGQRLQQSFGCCEKLPSGYVGSVRRVWASQPRAGCRGEAGAMPGTLGLVPHSWGHPDVPVMVLQLLTALICIPSSSCSDAWVRKISECKDYT